VLTTSREAPGANPGQDAEDYSSVLPCLVLLVHIQPIKLRTKFLDTLGSKDGRAWNCGSELTHFVSVIEDIWGRPCLVYGACASQGETFYIYGFRDLSLRRDRAEESMLEGVGVLESMYVGYHPGICLVIDEKLWKSSKTFQLLLQRSKTDTQPFNMQFRQRLLS